MRPNVEIPDETKASVSDPVVITPGLNELVPEEQMPENVPRVVFLDKPDIQVTPSEATITDQSTVENVELSEQPILVPECVAQTEQTTEGGLGATAPDEQRLDRGLMDYRSHTDDDSCFGMETDTGSIARSTLAQALYCPAKTISLACPNDSSNESSIPPVPVERGPVPLTGSCRAIIKQCFSETNPI